LGFDRKTTRGQTTNNEKLQDKPNEQATPRMNSVAADEYGTWL